MASKRVVLVTGRAAESSLLRVVSGLRLGGVELRILTIDVPVMSALKAHELARKLRGSAGELRGADLVLVPGSIEGDVSLVSEVLGVKVVKGPRDVNELPRVLKAVAEGAQLSSSLPAEEVITLLELSRLKRVISERRDFVHVAGLKVPLRPPPFVVIAEVPSELGAGGVAKAARELVEKGADALVVRAGGTAQVSELLSRLAGVGAPLGVEAEDPDVVIEAVEHGAVLHVGLNERNVSELATVSDRALFVATSSAKGAEAALKEALRVVREADKLGYGRLALDLPLKAPGTGFVECIAACNRLAPSLPAVPLHVRVTGAVEPIDADSHGLNAFVTLVAGELGASMLYVSEGAAKTVDSVAEVKLASVMASLSMIKGGPPRDVGVDLLVLKDKHRRSPSLSTEAGVEVVNVEGAVEPKVLDRNYVVISVDHEAKVIEATVYSSSSNRPLLTVRGRDGMSLARVIISRGLIQMPDHLAYLGYELARAEIALQLGKSYEQDSPLFETCRDKIKGVMRWLR